MCLTFFVQYSCHPYTHHRHCADLRYRGECQVRCVHENQPFRLCPECERKARVVLQQWRRLSRWRIDARNRNLWDTLPQLLAEGERALQELRELHEWQRQRMMLWYGTPEPPRPDDDQE